MDLATAYVSARQRMENVRPFRKGTSRQQQLTIQTLQEWEAGKHLDGDELLGRCLTYASESVPFYREHFARNPQRDPGRLSDWPILNRNHIWDYGEHLRSAEPLPWRTWTHASGGSTGKPVIVQHDEYFAAKASALRRLSNRLFLGGPHYNQLILWGMNREVSDSRPRKMMVRAKDYLREKIGIRTTHVNTFEFSRDKLNECARVLRRQQPTYIFGYAGSVYELAKYLEEHNIEFPKRTRLVGTTAQTLHDFMREKIEKVFGCRVCDHYGSREAGPLAWQHPSGPMCFPKFFSRVEVVDGEGRAVAPGESGRILVTTLHNFGMPLIRYDIGDTGILGEEMEYGGYPFATLRKISGRESEEFINPRGSRICGPFFINLFYYRPWLDQFHIVQRDFDLIEIQYVLKPGHALIPEQERREIDGRIRQVMTETCRIDWKRVDEVPTTGAGKRLFIRREMVAPEPKRQGGPRQPDRQPAEEVVE